MRLCGEQSSQSFLSELRNIAAEDVESIGDELGTPALYRPVGTVIDYPIMVVPAIRLNRGGSAGAQYKLRGVGGPSTSAFHVTVQIPRRLASDADHALGPHVGASGGVTQVRGGDTFTFDGSDFGEANDFTCLVDDTIHGDPASPWWMLPVVR